MEPKLAIVATFGSRLEAELAQSVLDSVEIESALSADDVGGTYFPLQLTSGVRLLVAANQVAQAREILNQDLSGEWDTDDDDDHENTAAVSSESSNFHQEEKHQLGSNSLPAKFENTSYFRKGLYNGFGLITGFLCGLTLVLINFMPYLRNYRPQPDGYEQPDDTNADGVADTWVTYRNSRLSLVKQDTNFDRAIDTTYHYQKGILSHQEIDTNFDGYIDSFCEYNSGVLALCEHDNDFNGINDSIAYFNNAVMYRTEIRPNGGPLIRVYLWKYGTVREEHYNFDKNGKNPQKIYYDEFGNRVSQPN
ncbi:MAG: DUF2007 domain-containing protein [Cyanobacteria bacterium P01_G01_bin.54]